MPLRLLNNYEIKEKVSRFGNKLRHTPQASAAVTVDTASKRDGQEERAGTKEKR